MEQHEATITPRVSVVIANYNGAAFLAAALRSALGQSLHAIEVILVDDRSTDDSVAIARAIAANDGRLVVDVAERNGGPGAARNRGLALARGDWVSVLDSDDLMHHQRLERLLADGEASGADIVADDLLLFDEDNSTAPRRFLASPSPASRWISTPDYLDSGRMFGRAPSLGFLKPIFRSTTLGDIRYDEGLRIAEDDFLVIRLLARGARYRIVPSIGYFYRKHGASVSHRIGAGHIMAIAAANHQARGWFAREDRDALAALDRRNASFARALAFTHAVDALKARRPARAAVALARRPDAVPLLRMLAEGAAAKLRRWRTAGWRGPADPRQRHASVIVRGAPSSEHAATLAAIAADLHRARIVPHLIELAPAGAAAKTPVGYASHRRFDTDMPEGGWSDAERQFVTQHARARGDVLIASSAAAAEGLVYALRPDAAMTVINAATPADRSSWPSGVTLLPPPVTARTAAATPHCVLVGENEGADVIGLRWLLDEVWPRVLAGAPHARLDVVGTVGLTLDMLPTGVTRTGEGARGSATLALVPLTFGAGAAERIAGLADRGLPVIATGVALGTHSAAARKVERHDDATAFADAVIRHAAPGGREPSALARWLAG